MSYKTSYKKFMDLVLMSLGHVIFMKLLKFKIHELSNQKTMVFMSLEFKQVME